MITVICVAGVVVGSAALENRLIAAGGVTAAKQVKSFSRFFLIGSGGWIAYEWITGMIGLLN